MKITRRNIIGKSVFALGSLVIPSAATPAKGFSLKFNKEDYWRAAIPYCTYTGDYSAGNLEISLPLLEEFDSRLSSGYDKDGNYCFFAPSEEIFLDCAKRYAAKYPYGGNLFGIEERSKSESNGFMFWDKQDLFIFRGEYDRLGKTTFPFHRTILIPDIKLEPYRHFRRENIWKYSLNTLMTNPI